MRELIDEYAQQIAEKDGNGDDFMYSGKSVISILSMMANEFEQLVAAKTDNNVFVWKEDSSGVEYVQAFFDGCDMIDTDSHYDVLVIKRKGE